MLHPTEQLIEEIWEALGRVLDPCHQRSGHDLSILDLGLVNRVTPVADHIEIGLTLTEVSCVFAYLIIERIESLAEDFPEVARFRVIVEPLPSWTPDRLSERARTSYRNSRTIYGSKLFKLLTSKT